jgi:hypothetical protein
MDDGGALPTTAEALQKWRDAEQGYADVRANECATSDDISKAALAEVVAHREYLDVTHRTKRRCP